jgi:hypothetical protein
VFISENNLSSQEDVVRTTRTRTRARTGGRRGRRGGGGVDGRRLGVDKRRRDPNGTLRIRETMRTTARDTREPTRPRAQTRTAT